MEDESDGRPHPENLIHNLSNEVSVDYNNSLHKRILFKMRGTDTLRSQQIIDSEIVEQQSRTYSNVCKALYVCMSFFVLFIAFFSSQNLTSQVMKNNDLGNTGFILLAVLYLFIGVGSVVSPAVLRQWGITKCLVLGGIGHFVFVFAQTLPAWRFEYPVDNTDEFTFAHFFQLKSVVIVLLVISVIINGLGASIIWVA